MAIARLIRRKLVCIQGKDTAFQFRRAPPGQTSRKLSAATSLVIGGEKNRKKFATRPGRPGSSVGAANIKAPIHLSVCVCARTMRDPDMQQWRSCSQIGNRALDRVQPYQQLRWSFAPLSFSPTHAGRRFAKIACPTDAQPKELFESHWQVALRESGRERKRDGFAALNPHCQAEIQRKANAALDFLLKIMGVLCFLF